MNFKFGAHQFLWKSHWTDGDASILDQARSLGLILFEVSLGDDVSFNYQRLGRRAEKLGIELSIGPGNLWPMECNISHDDPDYRIKGHEWHRGMIERAAQCGAVAYCGAIYSHPGYVCRRQPPTDELPRAAENLHILAGFAAGLGVRLVIEPMSRFRNHLVNTAAQAVHLARMADHPNLFVNLDTFHMITEERDYGAAIRGALPVLWGVHTCENDRGVPGGGLVPWMAVFEALAMRKMRESTPGTSDATGCVRLLMETYRTGPEGFGFERGIFQNLAPDPEQFVQEGLRFLQECAQKAIRNSNGLFGA